MFTYLKKTISFRNLSCHQLKGQIATLLMLLMVAVLIFLLITVNLGKVSLTSTRVSNATDDASLRLASRLATQSKAMYDAIIDADGGIDAHGQIKKCKLSGVLGMIVAIGVAIAIAISGQHWAWGFWATAFIAGGAAAAAGAFTQGVIMGGGWSGAAWGAMNGFMIGFTIGAASAAGLTTTTLTSVTISMATGEIIAATIVTAISVGAVMAALSIASMLYLQTVRDAAVSEAISKVCQQIPEPYTAMREDIFYVALSQLVDDQERVKDANDIDKDGDTEEMISNFDNWFYQRAKDLKVALASTSAVSFFQYLTGYVLGSGSNTIKGFLNQIDRKEVECTDSVCSGCATCSEGPVVELARKLKTNDDPTGNPSPYTISFWQPGPDRDALLNWYNQECETCSAPSGFDSVDFTHKEYEDLIDVTEAIRIQYEQNMEAFVNSAGSMANFYISDSQPPEAPEPEPGSAIDFYTTLGDILNGDSTQSPPMIGMTSWRNRIQTVRTELPRCQLAYKGYYPNQSNEDTQTPCGPPYAPDGSNPFYPCVWKKVTYNSPVEEMNFPNYPCRLTPAEKNNLTTQLDSLSAFVQDLPSHILNDPANSSLFTAGACASPSVSDGNPPTITITITNISLDGDDKPAYSTASATSDAKIEYTFKYEVNGGCVDASGNETVFSNPPGIKTIEETLPGVRDVVEITEANSLDTFLAKVADMQSNLSGIQPTAQNPFVTIDGDKEDEFVPVISTLQNQEETIKQLRLRMEAYRTTIAGGPTDGSGSLTYSWERPNGHYAVTVETGPFHIPAFVNYHTGNWFWGHKCMKVADYCDNISGTTTYTFWFGIPIPGPLCPYNTGGTWVRITKEEPANINLPRSSLGRWNPFSRNKLTITKRSYSYFSYNKVGIAKIRE